eukprot:GHVN01029791.1.p1 GENE.GHVN01029791.1~~GHVN01029791.1.p1  ORF type:complete len:390 (+),score=107.64 GHVN01029791.1:560-1729(+)
MGLANVFLGKQSGIDQQSWKTAAALLAMGLGLRERGVEFIDRVSRGAKWSSRDFPYLIPLTNDSEETGAGGKESEVSERNDRGDRGERGKASVCLFRQSRVPAVASLTLMLAAVTPTGWLNRMIEYREEAQGVKQITQIASPNSPSTSQPHSTTHSSSHESPLTSLFLYPLLMGADILSLRGTHVPVGEDQRQHLEIIRRIVKRLNSVHTGTGFSPIPVPQPLYYIGSRDPKRQDKSQTRGLRVMSLTGATTKMSKSSATEYGVISMTEDSDEAIAHKIKMAKTDSFKGLEINNPNRPESDNLARLLAACLSQSVTEVVSTHRQSLWYELKPIITEAVINVVRPIRARYRNICDLCPNLVDHVLHAGEAQANKEASTTLKGLQRQFGMG